MVEFSFSKIGSVTLAVMGFIMGFVRLTEGTIVGQFLRWFPFGWGWLAWLIDAVVQYFAYIGAVAFAFIFLQWTRNAYILGTLAIMFVLFTKFGLKSIGAG